MKWINLAERQPNKGWRGIIRRLSDKNTKGAFLWWNKNKNEYTGVFYEPDSISAGIDPDLHKYEWLDEDEGMPVEENRCCEQNDKLRARISKLSKLPEDTPIGDHFAEISKWIPDTIECGYSPNDYPEDFWEGVSKEVKNEFHGLLHIVPPVFHEILRFYMDVIEEVKGQKITSQIEVDYLKYKNAEISYQQFIDKWL